MYGGDGGVDGTAKTLIIAFLLYFVCLIKILVTV